MDIAANQLATHFKFDRTFRVIRAKFCCQLADIHPCSINRLVSA
jgi:hypothetical protein